MNEALIAALKNLKEIPTLTYQKGDILFKEGANARDKMYILVSGQLSVIKKQGIAEIEINQILPGAFFGEIAIISNRPRVATVQVASDVARVGEISKDKFLLLCQKSPEFMMMLLTSVIERIYKADIRIEELNKALNSLQE